MVCLVRVKTMAEVHRLLGEMRKEKTTPTERANIKEDIGRLKFDAGDLPRVPALPVAFMRYPTLAGENDSDDEHNASHESLESDEDLVA
jgi:hypothetical protein